MCTWTVSTVGTPRAPRPGKAGGSGAVAGAGQQHALPVGMTTSDHQHMLDAIVCVFTSACEEGKGDTSRK
jgi:hypothetical protein